MGGGGELDGAQTNQSKEKDVTYHQEEMHRKIQLAAERWHVRRCVQLGMRARARRPRQPPPLHVEKIKYIQEHSSVNYIKIWLLGSQMSQSRVYRKELRFCPVTAVNLIHPP